MSREKKIVTRGNQQGGLVQGLIGSHWYRAMDGGLVNLELAQKIDVFRVDDKVQVSATYNDGSEVVLAEYGEEDDAWAELDRVAQVLYKHFELQSLRVRLGHG